MTELQQGRYDQLLRRVGDLKGGGSKVNEALEDLFPVLEVEDTVPELLALAGWRTAWQSTERPSVMGQVTKSQLINPADSGFLVAVTQFLIITDGVTKLQVEIGTAEIGTPVAGLYRDSRFGTPRATVALVSSADNIPTGGGLRLTSNVTADFQNSIRDDNGIVVLAPGSTLDIGTVSGRIVLTVNYFWRERIAEPSELNF